MTGRRLTLSIAVVLMTATAACSSPRTAAPSKSTAAASTAATTGATEATSASTPASSSSTTGASSASSASGSAGGTTVPTGATSAGTGPAGDAFYRPPDPLPPGKAGDLIWWRPFAAPTGSNGFLILYRSTAVDGSIVAVSGTVIVPATPAPAGGRQVLAWAHATTGLGDSCATSKAFEAGRADEQSLLVPVVLGQGLTLVATDYQGLGTPGDHTYLVNKAEGRNVLDAVRAAGQLPAIGITPTSPVVLVGHSQGGAATAMAAELAPTYAPELHVVGAAAGAPPGDLLSFGDSLVGTESFGYELMVLDGFRAAYPSIRMTDLLTAAGAQALDDIATLCSGAILARFKGQSAAQYLIGSPLASAALAPALKENTTGYIHTTVPLFIFHGEADTLVAPAISKAMYDRACAIGNPVVRKTYPGADHVSVLLPAVRDLLAFVHARLNGEPFVSGCTS